MAMKHYAFTHVAQSLILSVVEENEQPTQYTFHLSWAYGAA